MRETKKEETREKAKLRLYWIRAAEPADLWSRVPISISIAMSLGYTTSRPRARKWL